MVSSCGTMRGSLTEYYLKTGELKSSKNQNFYQILKDGRSIIFGKVEIFLDEVNITKSCTIGFNDHFDRRNTVLFEDELGDALIDIEKQENFFAGIACGRKLEGVAFDYYFKKHPFKVSQNVSYFGQYNFYFSSIESKDLYRYGRQREPWLKKVSHKFDQDIQKDMEKRYQIVSKEKLHIIKLNN